MITLINPNLVVSRNDYFTTGIVYMPIGLAYFAASLRAKGIPFEVIDSFGEKPNQIARENAFLIRGLTPRETAGRIAANTRAIVLYAITLASHVSLVAIIREIKKRFEDTPIIVVENSQAVTAYSLRHVQKEFFDVGATYCVTGEPERRAVLLIDSLFKYKGRKEIATIDGVGSIENGSIIYTAPKGVIDDLDLLAKPAWDVFPLQNYWRLGYAHGPKSAARYLPLLTSRGCPNACNFCVIPETNSRRWRARSARNVVDEMETFQKQYGVSEFHLEDLNPTVSNERTKEICREIINRKITVTWKLVAGTKAETIKDPSTIDDMASAGCRYISISPESGSPAILEKMNKSFDKGHALRIVRRMKENGIYSQACFLVGYPEETDADRKCTREMVREFTKEGIDEIALFIVTPVPGSAISERFSGYTSYSDLNFSPSWRRDYAAMNRFRLSLYRSFIFWKLKYHPLKLLRQPFNFLSRRFNTKMEMTPYRALHTMYVSLTRGAHEKH